MTGSWPVAGGAIPCPLPVIIEGGSSSGGLTDAELRAAAVPVSVSGSIPVTGTFWQPTQPVSIAGTVTITGGLTDTQLRAVPVPVSGTFWQATQPVSIASTVAVSGPLTDTQLRAAAVPVSIGGTVSVSGTFWPATQPVSGTVGVSGTVPVSGTFWQSTQPVSIAAMPSTPVTGTFWQTTQPVSIGATVAVRAAKDTSRSIVNAATNIAGVTAVTTEALLSLNVSRDGAATASATTVAVTSGKKLRIIGITAGVISTAAAVISARVSLRMNPSGAVAANSPILAILSTTQQAAALAEAGDTCVLNIPDGLEISGTQQIGLTQVCSAITGVVYASIIGFEY